MKSGSFDSYRAALSGTGADIGGERDDPPGHDRSDEIRLAVILRELFMANLNELTARNLPHEWTPDSPMGRAALVLGWPFNVS